MNVTDFSRVLPSGSDAYTVFGVPEEELPGPEKQPRTGFKKVKIEERTWQFRSCEMITEENEKIAGKYAQKICVIDEFAIAYLGISCGDLEDLQPKRGYETIEDSLLSLFGDDDWKGEASVREKKTHCHFFNHKRRSDPFYPIVDGAPVDKTLHAEYAYLLELKTRIVTKVVRESSDLTKDGFDLLHAKRR